jgi:pimeloyl-ACP methyl ester carboxylesterase
MKIVYIHGASATGESFNYIREHLNHDDDIVLEYSSKNGFEENLEQMKKILVDFDNMFFICHSLGGIYALHLAAYFKDQVLGAVTISTPYGGSSAADYAKYFLPFSRLLRDIGPNSRPMKLTNKIEVSHPWVNIVTVSGDSPWMVEPNDGVVTIASMKHRSDMQFIELNNNHYEAVISPKTVDILKQKLKEAIGDNIN